MYGSNPIKRIRHTASLAAMASLWLAAGGCDGPEEYGDDEGWEDIEDVESNERFLAFDTASEWLVSRVHSDVRVCLTGDGMTSSNIPTRRDQVRDAIMDWVAGIEPSSDTPLMERTDIQFSCSGEHVRINWSDESGRANVEAKSGDVIVCNLFSGDGYDVVLHEFGHIFGMGDTYVEGVWTCHPGQPDSLMCTLKTFLAPDDIQGIQEIYALTFPSSSTKRWFGSNAWCQASGSSLYPGDFNGDGREDLLCHSESSGSMWIDYADSSGALAGTNWSRSAQWCTASGAQLHVGDFNGDSRDDILCLNQANGWQHIDYANTSGRFDGTNWSNDLNWCMASDADLHVGDFNGDGRDDLLCNNTSNGWKHIDWASTSGTFAGTNWSNDLNWCISDGAEVHVGDFNSDGRDDLLCHNAETGWKHIDYSSTNVFDGTNWSSDMNWCFHDAAELHVADVDGDGADDMLCHDTEDGKKWVARASEQFDGTSRRWAMDWCKDAAAQLFTGDFDGDGASDMLCHNGTSGQRWLSFENP